MGYYGFGLHPVFVAARNWLSLLHEAKDPALFSDARILSIAVHPDFQGRGLGNALMRQGIRYLLAEAVPRIRLEVRPDNGPAVHIYEKLGFTTSGRTRDTQGDWLIMLKAMARNPQA
jgi:ribosomal protein S18 acetylase RimI-like enzyme